MIRGSNCYATVSESDVIAEFNTGTVSCFEGGSTNQQMVCLPLSEVVRSLINIRRLILARSNALKNIQISRCQHRTLNQ